MKIELHRILVRDVVNGYVDNDEEGVVGYGGKLNIRPKYQREFVYDKQQRNAVIDTVRKGFPLNVMYWMVNQDGGYEVLDGQQRTISIAQYVRSDFSVDSMMFHNLTEDEREQILNYELMVYFCDGTDRERLDWFETINIAGEELTAQELRNAVYTGPWLSDAKLKFSKSNCVASLLAGDGGQLMSGSPIRQELLEKAISWLSGGEIREYMAMHQRDENANELWKYFQNIIEWTRKTFTKYRSEMKGVEWGVLYNQFKDAEIDADAIEAEVQLLMQDDDVTKKSGIYSYVLTRQEKWLSIRSFNDKERREAYERQNGVCPVCGSNFDISEMEADHITPWSQGGKTIASNCQMLCRDDNRRKSNI